MVQFRPQAREVIAKIVYYGPPLGGKTTNLRTLYEGYPKNTRGELAVVPAGADRTIYFDFLPLDIGTLRNLKLRVQLYTVPGQVEYNSTRQLVLRGVDGIVFVADSQRTVLAANLESWLNLKENLAMQGLNPAEVPIVMQYNKRDLSEILEVENLDEFLNEFNVPFFEAVATVGIGVQETLGAAVKLVVRSLRDRFQLSTDGQAAGPPAAVAGGPAPATSGREPAPGVVVPFGAISDSLTPERGPAGEPGKVGAARGQPGLTQPVAVPGPKPVPEDTIVSKPRPEDEFLGYQLPASREPNDTFAPGGTASSIDEELFRVDTDPPASPVAPPAFSRDLPEAEKEPEAAGSPDPAAGGPFGRADVEASHPDSGSPVPDSDGFEALPAPPPPAVEEPPQPAADEGPAFSERDPAEITLPPRDLQGFVKSREPFLARDSSQWAETPFVTVKGREPGVPVIDDRSLVFATPSESDATQLSPPDEDWRGQEFPVSPEETPEGIAPRRPADLAPSLFRASAPEQHEDPFGSDLAGARAESELPSASEIETPYPDEEASAAGDHLEDLDDDPFGPAAPLEAQELDLEAPAMEEISEQLTAARESLNSVSPAPYAAGEEAAPFGQESGPAGEPEEEFDWFGAGAESQPAPPPDSGIGSSIGEPHPEPEFVGVPEAPVAASVQSESEDLIARSSPFDVDDGPLPGDLPEDPWSDDVVLPPDRRDPAPPPPAAQTAADGREPERVLSIPVSALRQVPSRALAQYGDVRELEIEVPVPALWTGGKRITLQLRLTLIPQEEDDGGSDHHS